MTAPVDLEALDELLTAYERWEAANPHSSEYSHERHQFSCACLTHGRALLTELRELRKGAAVAAIANAFFRAAKHVEQLEERDIESLLAKCDGKPTVREELEALRELATVHRHTGVALGVTDVAHAPDTHDPVLWAAMQARRTLVDACRAAGLDVSSDSAIATSIPDLICSIYDLRDRHKQSKRFAADQAETIRVLTLERDALDGALRVLKDGGSATIYRNDEDDAPLHITGTLAAREEALDQCIATCKAIGAQNAAEEIRALKGSP